MVCAAYESLTLMSCPTEYTTETVVTKSVTSGGDADNSGLLAVYKDQISDLQEDLVQEHPSCSS